MSISLKNWPLKKIHSTPDFPSIKLEGFRVYLRPPCLSDGPQWCALREANRAHLSAFEPKWHKRPPNQEHFIRRLERQSIAWQAGLSNSFLIFNKADDTIIGGMNINNICRGAAQYASLGYWIAKDYEGQGLMTEALHISIKHSFRTMELHRLHASCLLHNQRSKKLLERASFTQEGMAEKYLEIEGKWQDHILYGLPIENWKQRQQQ